MKRPSLPSVPFTFTPPLWPYAIPCGFYNGRLREVRREQRDDDNNKPQIRFTFDIISGPEGPMSIEAIREYAEDKEGRAKLNIDLLAFLEESEVLELQGMPGEIDLIELIGTVVDISISTHPRNDDSTYSKIQSIHRAGEFTSDQNMGMELDQPSSKTNLPLKRNGSGRVSTKSAHPMVPHPKSGMKGMHLRVLDNSGEIIAPLHNRPKGIK